MFRLPIKATNYQMTYIVSFLDTYWRGDGS